MIDQRKKQSERFYVESAARMLGKSWTLEPDRENPDFIVTENEDRFGLEVTSFFVGPIESKGALEKERESTSERRLLKLRMEFDPSDCLPLCVRLVGDTCDANLSIVVPTLHNLALQKKEIGYRTSFSIDEGPARLTVHVTRSFRHEWYDVGHRVGWVGVEWMDQFARTIAKKAKHLERYRDSSKLSDIRLLIVSDRTMNSGRISLAVPPVVDCCGFQAVYLFPYPETVHILMPISS